MSILTIRFYLVNMVAINEQAINMIQSAKLKTGETVQVYGVFSAWIFRNHPGYNACENSQGGRRVICCRKKLLPQTDESPVIIETHDLSRC